MEGQVEGDNKEVMQVVKEENEGDYADKMDDQKKNTHHFYCKLCNSHVLLPGNATFIKKSIFLHHERKQKDQTVGETLNYFWLVTKMIDFENIGFSHTVDNTYKYLTCADCEVPIMGVQFLESDKAFYLAADRVKYSATKLSKQ